MRLRLVGSGHLRTLAALRSHAPKQLILLWEMRFGMGHFQTSKSQASGAPVTPLLAAGHR